ncbi:A/G-specific adenine glycosylase [Hellea sp.]|nr:A/G-specific adenine glycosylase [Hellea sp.]
MKKNKKVLQMQSKLLAWYDLNGRTLPWRLRPEDKLAGKVADPYSVWLSEIMLQQTTIAHATPYWERFISEFPTVSDLADSKRERIMTMWSGLGYYARARNLHKCAQLIRDQYSGFFPKNESELLKLPGIGPYAAAAIAAICFDEPTNIVDGNVERVISRIFKIEDPLPKYRNIYRNKAGDLAPIDRPGDYGQALMDLGSTICTPKSPKCTECPWEAFCAAKKVGAQVIYPIKVKKNKIMTRYGAVFILINNGAVFIKQRPDNGLLGGMMGFPSTPWDENKIQSIKSAPVNKNWEKCPELVFHTFSHFKLELEVYRAQGALDDNQGIWADIENIGSYALPTVMLKAFKISMK